MSENTSVPRGRRPRVSKEVVRSTVTGLVGDWMKRNDYPIIPRMPAYEDVITSSKLPRSGVYRVWPYKDNLTKDMFIELINARNTIDPAQKSSRAAMIAEAGIEHAKDGSTVDAIKRRSGLIRIIGHQEVARANEVIPYSKLDAIVQSWPYDGEFEELTELHDNARSARHTSLSQDYESLHTYLGFSPNTDTSFMDLAVASDGLAEMITATRSVRENPQLIGNMFVALTAGYTSL